MEKISADAPDFFKPWAERAAREADAALAAWMQNDAPRDLLEKVLLHSPYLSRLLLLHPALLRDALAEGADAVQARLMAEMKGGDGLMRALRLAKGRVALLAALADIAGWWRLERVTHALSDFAERCLALSVAHLLAEAHRRGEIAHADADQSGVIILALGKLGGRELNYSSDIDLIVLFERGRLGYAGRHNEQHFMNRLAHDLVELMQQRTEDGYVFRTDLRLRPDPASTPPAVSFDAAVNYYESVGQNWERAAMIKARPVAGDLAAGERFLAAIAPFMWRRSLDFAAINDIHSIKRQMDTRQQKIIRLPGHNIKLGLGGIREIEFYAQIHQLIWGGRRPSLRSRATCDTLAHLAETGLIDAGKEETLRAAYVFLRTLEHRLQMVADQQTHSLPESPEEISGIAAFMGYDSAEAFGRELLSHLNAVHEIYASSFQSAEKLGGEGNLVFTGSLHDPDTLETLRRMGYAEPQRVSEIVMGWHHGSKRSTRTKRARELLTELMPTLLKRLSETADPDTAFLRFNDFLTHLPAGVQLFSLFNVNPQLLGLIADIMGSAPVLAGQLSKTPALLDAVLYADFYGPLPAPDKLKTQLSEMLFSGQDFEQRMNAVAAFRNEKRFQAGVQLLKSMIDATAAGRFLSELADVALAVALEAVTAELARGHGEIPGGRFAVIGLGKLGSREMTFTSDIDLVFVYDAPQDAQSTGAKPLSASVYYNRLAQRFIGALTAMGREGRLYDADARLRPGGAKGHLATSMGGLEQYFAESAWTFEFMAFTKARPVAGDAALCASLEQFIAAQIRKPRDAEKLRAEVNDMRGRIAREFGGGDPWDIKYVRGGLIDVDFIAQYLLLLHAPQTPGARPGAAADIFSWLKEAGRLEPSVADDLLAAERFLGQVFHIIRLCCDRDFNEATAPPGLHTLLCNAAEEKNIAALKSRLLRVEQSVLRHYDSFLASKP